MPRIDFKKGTNLNDLLALAIQTVVNTTNGVTKITRNSVLGALLQAVARIGQRAMKDIALANSENYVEEASSQYLDEIGRNRGITSRRPGASSVVYLRLVGEIGTTYSSGDTGVSFRNDDDIIFRLENDVTIGGNGFEYVLARSTITGLQTNVAPFTINNIENGPAGHIDVFNDFAATGGRDEEGDAQLRERIQNTFNNAAVTTLARIEEVAKSFQPEILRIVNTGSDEIGNIRLSVATVNGRQYSREELDSLLQQVGPYMSLSDVVERRNDVSGVLFDNIPLLPIDVEARIERRLDIPLATLYTEIAVRLTRVLDYSNFSWDSPRIRWDEVFDAVKRTPGVEAIDNSTFLPRADIVVPFGVLPRIRRVTLFNIDGSIMEDRSLSLQNYFFPNTQNRDIQELVS